MIGQEGVNYHIGIKTIAKRKEKIVSKACFDHSHYQLHLKGHGQVLGRI